MVEKLVSNSQIWPSHGAAEPSSDADVTPHSVHFLQAVSGAKHKVLSSNPRLKITVFGLSGVTVMYSTAMGCTHMCTLPCFGPGSEHCQPT